MKAIFTENRFNIVIDVWYKNEEEFRLIAKELVKEHLVNGGILDDDFMSHMIGKHIEWEESKVEG